MCDEVGPGRWRDIMHLGLFQHLVAEVRAEKAFSVEIHRVAEQLGKLPLDSRLPNQPHRTALLEFHQNVHMAIGLEILAKNGAEKRQPPDAMRSAERSNFVLGDLYPCPVNNVLHPLGRCRPSSVQPTPPATLILSQFPPAESRLI